MDQCTLYEKILGLSSPWYVSEVGLDEGTHQVHILVECDSRVELACPECGKTSPRYDSRKRTWRHLDTCQFQTLVSTHVPRIQCSEHGCRTIQVPWAEDSSRYTHYFEAYVLRWLKEASIRAVSRQFNLSWNAIDRIMERAVKRGLSARGEMDIHHLSVDETSFKKGREYVTIISNAQGQVLAVEEGRSSDSLSNFYLKLSKDQLSAIQSISMDMSPAYQKATKQHVPHADKKISFDHFHIAQSLTDSLNETRKAELLRLEQNVRKEAYQTRYYWLRSSANLKEHHWKKLNELKGHFVNTTLFWYFKERARSIWKGNRVRGAKSSWIEWIGLAKATKIPALQATAKQIEKHLWGILNAMRFQVSNALAEAINSKIRILRVKAYGYRNKERFKRAILFHFGGLSMEPTH